VKPPPFDYRAPRSLDEALDLLRTHGGDAKILAGGQSLGPLLNLRLAAPSVLIDINRIPDLAYERVEVDGSLRLGATVRQRALERSRVVADGWPLLAEAIASVGHPTIRNRGTIGGSLAHADPSAELPAAALALDARLVLRGARASRLVDSRAFFVGVLTTCLAPDEMLVEVRVPAAVPRSGYCWMEFAPRHGDYAIVGVAAAVTLDAGGAYRDVRLAYAGVADAPHLAPEVGPILAGALPTTDGQDEAASRAAAALSPSSDALASAGYKRHLAHVLARRALARATARAHDRHAA
jgi:carbon-monoxide dehydrogenase medium subunit